MSATKRLLARAVERWTTPALRSQVRELALDDRGHGYDVFGAHRDWVGFGITLNRLLYERYFRVRSYGAEHIPAQGPAILAANHSGMLPFDAVMLYCDVVRSTRPPRLPRPVADRFVPLLPFVGTFFARVGVVSGTRRNVRTLLESGELMMIFPEGTPGIGKRFSDRYQLQYWREGHAELAVRHRTPVVPVAIIGAEEQWPQLARIDGFKLFGAPYLPIPATPIPLPVRYHIHYGEPIHLHERYAPEESDNPKAIREAALEVKRAVQELIDRGLQMREGIFK